MIMTSAAATTGSTAGTAVAMLTAKKEEMKENLQTKFPDSEGTKLPGAKKSVTDKNIINKCSHFTYRLEHPKKTT